MPVGSHVLGPGPQFAFALDEVAGVLFAKLLTEAGSGTQFNPLSVVAGGVLLALMSAR